MKIFYLLLVCLMMTNCGHNRNKMGPGGKDRAEAIEHIKIESLTDELNDVFKGKDVFDYIGITSNGIDCLYFPNKQGKFSIEFEVLSDEQKPFVKQLKDFATARGIATSMTTYTHKKYYNSTEKYNVIRIEANTDIENISALATAIESKIFHNDSHTVYDVVPQ